MRKVRGEGREKIGGRRRERRKGEGGKEREGRKEGGTEGWGTDREKDNLRSWW